MKEETIAFSTIPISHQNGFSDRISFIYIEYAKIIQTDSGVIALSTDEEGNGLKSFIQIPVAALCLISLGPGTSITNAAMTSCARSGCVIQFTGGGGFPVHSSITSLSSTSRWAIAQATVVSDQSLAKKVAKEFYRKQFNTDAFDGSITQMRGIEGSLMKKVYAEQAKKYRLGYWRRDTKSDDNVNISLNIANGLLYGICSSLTGALSMNQSLGVIHRGHFRSFLFDLADLYKANLVIPIAFSMAKEDKEDVPQLTRRAIRKELYKQKVLDDIFRFVITTFEPYTPQNDNYRLIGTSDEVDGQINYANKKSEEAVL